MLNTRRAVARFYVGLADFTPRVWVSIVTAFPIDAYTSATEPGRQAIVHFAQAATDDQARAVLQAVQDEAPLVARDFFPTLDQVRESMRPFKPMGVDDLSADNFEVLREQAIRRVLLAASGIALADHLSAAQLAGLYQPFEGFIPLSGVLIGSPDEDETDLDDLVGEADAPPAPHETAPRRSPPEAIRRRAETLAHEEQIWGERKRATLVFGLGYVAALAVFSALGWWGSGWLEAVALFVGLGVVYGVATTLRLGVRRMKERKVASDLSTATGVIEPAAAGAVCVDCGIPATHALAEAHVPYCRRHASEMVRLSLLAAREA